MLFSDDIVLIDVTTKDKCKVQTIGVGDKIWRQNLDGNQPW